MCILKRIHNIISPNIVPISLKGIRLRTKLHELHLDNNKICFLSVDADSAEKTKKTDSPPLNIRYLNPVSHTSSPTSFLPTISAHKHHKASS